MNAFPIRPNDRFDAMSTCYCVQALTQTSSPNTYIAFQCCCEVISRNVSGQYGWCRTADLFSLIFPYLNYPTIYLPITLLPYCPCLPCCPLVRQVLCAQVFSNFISGVVGSGLALLALGCNSCGDSSG